MKKKPPESPADESMFGVPDLPPSLPLDYRAARAICLVADWLDYAEKSWGLADNSNVLSAEDLEAVRAIAARVKATCITILTPPKAV